ncbi:C45 family autoproteolytic acyltransferase/hydolase [Billgrantia gudaonensis]|uniref:Acyl-coenzyme A:6-aminopenicillanic acid acyl-transferase n=1 Tax=Billgrantia gudaonensis TaxID=376427 RepID=A0A1G8NLI2_9GAMM|nr:C45 family peptidase [Halomonas gudaonensis]SDI80977.1 Acyl-coenzyme A:6-aminopenicillanic acid acyl-transferase [Halomonas gudaonensis]
MSDIPSLDWLTTRGSHFDIGLALGRRGRAAVRDQLRHTALWQRIVTLADSPAVARMRAYTAHRFPRVMAELNGLAEGLALPLDDVFAWHCRGELLAGAPEGCTTLLLPGETPILAHNEDGLPCLDGTAFLVHAMPDDQPAFLSFCYPGSLPGHTFAMTDAGLVQTVNNLRLTGLEPEVPRMVLGRATLAQPSVTAALERLEAAPACAGFHFGLARLGEPDLTSVEFGAGQACHRPVSAPQLHANHALYHPAMEAGQVITRSSRDRQHRGEALLAEGERDPLAILRDGGLPIFRRSPDDPDDENTLATVCFRLLPDDILWEVHAPGQATPRRGSLQTLFGNDD